MENIETITLEDGVEFEEVIKNLRKYSFPTVTLTSNKQMCFNIAATKSGIIPDYIKWLVSTDYVIGIPAEEDGRNSFKTWLSKWCATTACFPVTLSKEKKVQPGTYKLYKYKNGFAFKRYEKLP